MRAQSDWAPDLVTVSTPEYLACAGEEALAGTRVSPLQSGAGDLQTVQQDASLELAPKPVASIDNTPLFRPEVLAERQSQWLGTVLLGSPWSHRLFAGFALLAAIAVIALIVFADFTRKARVDGWLMPRQGLVRVVAPRAGVITGLLVEEGMEVAKGDRLLTISAELQSAELGATQTEIGRNLREQRRSLLDERTRREQLLTQEQQALFDRVVGVQDELQEIDNELELLESRTALTKRQLVQHRNLREQGYISQIAFQELEGELLEQDTRLSSLRRVRIGLQREMQAAQRELEELPLKSMTGMAALEREIAMIDQQLAGVEAQREIVLTATQSGTVTAIIAEIGGHADISRPLLSIVPAGSELQAHLYGPSSTVGFLKPGQHVLLRYEAYPYQKFGHHKGVIANVSRSPLSQTAIEPQLAALAGNNEPVYRITVDLERQTVLAYGEELPLQPGMQLEADIELETRPIYEWILDPLYTLTGKLPQ